MMLGVVNYSIQLSYLKSNSLQFNPLLSFLCSMVLKSELSVMVMQQSKDYFNNCFQTFFKNYLLFLRRFFWNNLRIL